ncbi:MAG: amidohydrolase family protein, partial [Rudaea sp.]
MPRDLALINANIRTLDPRKPFASALAARDGRIVYVGDEPGAAEFLSPQSLVVDANGHLVLPAFTDAHVHFCGWAQALDRVSLEGCRSLEEAVSKVAGAVASAQPGQFIHGWGWNHLDWQNPVFPDRTSLDRVAAANPVILTRKDGHSAWVNSAALQVSGVTRAT